MPRRFYISSNGRLKRKENTIYFETEQNGETVKKVLPVNDIDSIYVFGDICILKFRRTKKE